MSIILIVAGVAVGTPVALVSLAYFAAASAYRRQAFQDEEKARLWIRTPVRPQPLAPTLAAPAAHRDRARVLAPCTVRPTAPTKLLPRPGQPSKRRAAR